jgi:hypothetical protein
MKKYVESETCMCDLDRSNGAKSGNLIMQQQEHFFFQLHIYHLPKENPTSCVCVCLCVYMYVFKYVYKACSLLSLYSTLIETMQI